MWWIYWLEPVTILAIGIIMVWLIVVGMTHQQR